ncbi:MAG: site-specific DNA-methyltransferase [Magnetococcales bacterium]|nr:site-specific DNA-methyltransferase [Magnetococcales bacterium]
MQRIITDDPLAMSTDLLSKNVARLRALFPEAFTEGQIDFAVLKALLGGHVDEREEKYGLNWHGKRQARRLALTPSTGTLRPCPTESVDWETTQNLIIEGDNLEVLKLLQKSYAGRIKLIYIDPPYNTGKDFVYPDDYRDNIHNYLELTGQVDDEGRRMSSNTEASGRFHTDWLNMMYPRLRLAHNLLRDDGVIMISIDDHEFSNLRRIGDEIFGEENFLITFVWQRRQMADSRNEDRASIDHEYVSCWMKQGARLKGTPIDKEKYANPDNDPRGPWFSADLTGIANKDERPHLHYDLVNPHNGLVYPPSPTRGWSCSPTTMQGLIEENLILWPAKPDGRPRRKKFLHDVTRHETGFSSWLDVGKTTEGTRIIQELFKDKVFPFSKPPSLIQTLIDQATEDKEGIILDFFAGSGTTAHAVLDLNKQDGGNRRFILVQLPEPTGHKEYPTIAEITKERVRRVIKKRNAEESGLLDLNDKAKQDRGFRVFKLDASNLKPWDSNPEDLSKTLLDHVDHILPDRSEQDLLFELLLKLGLELTVPMETRTIAEKQVHAIDGGALLVCLAEKITRKEGEPLAQGILDWRRELAPAVSTTFVFRDSAFDDVAKTNLATILEQNLPARALAGIRSL